MILSFDPGVKNFSYTLVDERNMYIHRIGLLRTRIEEFNNEFVSRVFERQLDWIQEDFPVNRNTYIIAERFQNRGKFSGAQGEYINLMLGHIQTRWPWIECFGAMEWKGYIKREYVTEEIAKRVLREEYSKIEKRKCRKGYRKRRRKRKLRYHFEMEHLLYSNTLTEHEFDALGLSVFKAEKITGRKGLLWKLNDKLIYTKE